jgi:hypothetical protein
MLHDERPITEGIGGALPSVIPSDLGPWAAAAHSTSRRWTRRTPRRAPWVGVFLAAYTDAPGPDLPPLSAQASAVLQPTLGEVAVTDAVNENGEEVLHRAAHAPLE